MSHRILKVTRLFFRCIVELETVIYWGLGDWANFVFWGTFLKKLGRFLFWVIFYFSGQKNPQKIDYFWEYF